MALQEILKKADILEGLSQDEIAAVAELCEERSYKAGTAIFEESSRGEEVYLVKSGTVRIELALKGKTDVATVHRVTPGRSFGELALVDRGRRSATATCESDAEVLVLGRERLADLFESNNHIGYVLMGNLATILSARLRKTNLQLVASILWE